MSNLMSGAKMLLECLVREGVDCFFGYPGGVTLPFYDALYDHHIRHVLVRHEENACFAAEGYARATGKVGVCCATSGPGATNLITGLVDSHDGFDSDRRHHRPGDQQAHRQRRVPGSRHVRHHALLHQAQFHGEERGGAAADRARSVLHCLQRPPGPGAGRHSQGRFSGAGPLHAGDQHSSARLQGFHRRPHRPDQARRADDLGRRAAVGVRGRRHHRGGRIGGAARVRPNWWTRRWSAR